MTTTRQFSLALDALVELKQDMAAPPLRSTPVPFDQTQGKPGPVSIGITSPMTR